MDSNLPFTVHQGNSSPPEPIGIGVATPWSEVLIEELDTTIKFNPLLQPLGKYNLNFHAISRKRLRSWNRIFCLGVILAVLGMWGWLSEREKGVKFGDEQLSFQSELDGLKFIDATHPYIKVCPFDILGCFELT
jgi:hypothetical protein